MKVELINVGRDNICKTVDVKNINGIFKHLQQCLMSRGIELYPIDNAEGEYDVVVGMFRTVGKIKILSN